MRVSVSENFKIWRWIGFLFLQNQKFHGGEGCSRYSHGSFARLFNSANARPARGPNFARSGVKLLGVVGAARLECGEPATGSGELIRR
jgi:hypothetical protein